jgi:hypothetical protein
MSVHEQEQRAYRASLRAEEVLHASYEPVRKAERKARRATHRAEVVKWRIEGDGIRSRSLLRNEEGEDDYGQEETEWP